eukprot:c11619_g1_i2.p1 GENE.c11619_g1_i2~~c11619_g1_i2.p1  ORF type:complete len:184 (-),score=46.12 c11619_g1_i2:140-652(-)
MALAKLTSGVLPEPEKFFHAVVDAVCGKLTQLPHNATVEACKDAAKDALAIQRSDAEIKALLVSKGLEEPLSALFSAVLVLRADEVRSALIDSTFRSPLPTLRDFDWKLQMLMGSHAMSGHAQPLLQLHLQSSHSIGPVSAAIVEFTKDELDGMIENLESIELSLAQLKA